MLDYSFLVHLMSWCADEVRREEGEKDQAKTSGILFLYSFSAALILFPSPLAPSPPSPLPLPNLLSLSLHHSKRLWKSWLYIQESIVFSVFLNLTLVRQFSYAMARPVTVTTLPNPTASTQSTLFMTHQHHLTQWNILSFERLLTHFTLDSKSEVKYVQKPVFFSNSSYLLLTLYNRLLFIFYCICV